MSRGTIAEYKELLRLIEPIRLAGITIHVTIGNHDNREPVEVASSEKGTNGIHAEVIELPHAT